MNQWRRIRCDTDERKQGGTKDKAGRGPLILPAPSSSALVNLMLLRYNRLVPAPPSTTRVIRVMCSGRVSELLILKAFVAGADRVLIGSCHPGDCHYSKCNLSATRRITSLKSSFTNSMKPLTLV